MINLINDFLDEYEINISDINEKVKETTLNKKEMKEIFELINLKNTKF